MFLFRIISCILLSLPLSLVQGQKHIQMRLLDDKSGLSDRKVLAGFEDKKGFMWFAGGNGLHRYDGHRFVNFNKNNSALRADKIILALGLDDGMLILHGLNEYHCRSAGIIDYFEYSSQKVLPFKKAIPSAPFDESKVVWIHTIVDEGILFMLSDGSLFLMDELNSFSLLYKIPASLSWEEYANINFFVSEEFIVLSMPYKEMHLFIDRSNQNEQLVLKGRWHIVWENDTPKVYHQTKSGLISYEIQNKDTLYLRKISTTYFGSDSMNFHYNDHVNRKSLWFIPENGLYKQTEDGFSLIKEWNGSGIHEESINSCFEDSQGNIWICTAKGIYKININDSLFDTYLAKSSQDGLSIVDQTRGIFDDGDFIWIHQWEKVVSIQKSNKNIKKYTPPYKGINYAINKINDKIHIGGAGIANLTPQNKFSLIYSLFLIECWAIESINDQTLIVGTNSGLYELDLSKDLFTKIEISDRVSPEHIYRIKKENNSFLIVASNGIFEYNELRKLSPLVIASDLKVSSFYDAYMCSDSSLIIATQDAGLIHFHLRMNTVDRFSLSEGLTAKAIYRIEPGREEYVWLSSDKGLYAFNSKDKFFVKYTEKEGLPMTEFNRGSSFSHSDGSIYFGGVNGVVRFHKDHLPIENEKSKTKLILSEAHIENGYQEIEKLVFTFDEVFQCKFTRNTRSVKLFFSSLDFSDGEYTYGFFLEGYDKNWRYGNEPEITLSGLPYGNYSLKVKAISPNGNFIEKTFAVIEVPYPLYLKWWFLLFSAGVILSMVYLIVILRIKALKNEKQVLQMLVNEQTKDLKESLDFKEFLLQEIHHRIKNNLAIMDGMIELQMDGSTEYSTVKALQQTQLRLRSISILNQNLYYSSGDTIIDLKNFFAGFKNQYSAMIEERGASMQVILETQTSEISSRKAIPLGLIYNELITNSLKYAIIKDHPLLLTIQITQQNHILHCSYSDNGTGTIHFDLQRSSTLGVRLIRMFCRQLKTEATIDIENGFKMMFEVDLDQGL
jgi:two-component sensor histidine kinase/ligand-binding sensor domain-containing protein